MSNTTMIGRVIGITERGTFKVLTVEREAANEYERKNPDKTVIPFDVSPFAQKTLPKLRPGVTVAVSYSLVGSLWKERRFLSAAVESVEVIGAAADEPGAVTTDPTGAAPDDEPDPFASGCPF
jgi:hypothetical protein